MNKDMLMLRNLIIEKEFIIATANMELQIGGFWLMDHAENIRAVDREIAYRIEAIENQ